nr:MAG TPA: hypothetical protein [Caudoviricetes sp.]
MFYACMEEHRKQLTKQVTRLTRAEQLALLE